MSGSVRILAIVAVALAVAQGSLATEQAPDGAARASRDPLGEVDITAQRELARRVSKFVDQIAATANAEGLPRWQIPVCPLVTGLPRQAGELILTRISEAARAAEVRLAGERCRPNLYVIVIDDPQKALAAVGARKRTNIFGQANASVVREFIDTPRAVRVWYNYDMTDSFGMSPGSAQGCTYGPFCNVPIFDHTLPTRLSFNRLWNLTSVVLIVDKARLSTVSTRQLAGYAAMVGLADIRVDAHLGDAQTILRLFGSGAAAVPLDMTEWDQDFLKSLYSTEQKSKWQRSEIAHSMVRAMAHR